MSADPSRVNPLNCDAVTAECPVEASLYGYYPDKGHSIWFAILFGICFFANAYFGYRHKTWAYMAAMLLATSAAAIGYSGRIIMADNPYHMIGFQIQICCLTFSPALNSAAIYLTLKHFVRRFGAKHSLFRPKLYTWIFITADIFALVLQAAGGGIAASAGDNSGFRDTGDRLTVAGISWQVLNLIVFAYFSIDYFVRRHSASEPLSAAAQATRQDLKFRLFTGGLLIAFITVFIRCVYRIAEMSGGWRNPVMQNQPLFIGLDSIMVGLATVLQTFLHPGYCFPFMANTKSIAEDEAVAQEKLATSSSGSDQQV